jgi:tetratricopeptide (TPR) repeat protein
MELLPMLVDLAVTPVSEVFARLSRERRSGDLQIRSRKIVKTIFFDHGRVVFAASNMKKDRLGEALVALGRITDDEFSRAVSFMKEGEKRRRFGEALVRAGVMDKDELGRSVARQVKRIVLSLFEFTDGATSFEERPCAIPLEYMVSLSVHRLLYVGIKSMKSRELIIEGLGELDRYVSLAPVPPFRFGIKKCSAEELEIMEQAKGKVTLRRLCWAPGGLSLGRLRATYALLASGVLQEAQADAQPVLQMETSTFLLSALRKRPDPSAREAIRLEVQQELERSARLDREAWLRVSRSAPRDELGKALEEKMEHYHSLLDAAGDDASLKTDIEVVLGRASSMLRLARQATPAAAAPAPPVAAPAPPAAAPRASAPPSGAPRVSAPPPPPPPAPQTPPIDAERALEEPEPEPVRPAAPPTVAEAPPSSSSSSASAPAPPPSSAHSATSNMQIEHLLMEGEVRMTVSDYANAYRTYAKLVDLAPNDPGYRIKLAIAMAFYPTTAKQAEREFLEAVRLEPHNADIHYQFGLYYKAMRVRSRAITEMQTAVRLNPRHKQARQELEAMSPKDSALTSLKKLFR